MTPLMMISVFVSTYMCIVQGQTPCSTPNNTVGICIPIPDCPELNDLVKNRRRDPEAVNFLRASKCGYIEKIPKVCCEVKTPAPNSCLTPDGDVGQCIDLYSCRHIVEVLTNNPPPEFVRFVQKSRCNGPVKYSVCCGPNKPRPAATPEPQPVPFGQCKLTAAPPDPRTECCGRDSSAGNRIIGGNATSVDQYPWLALIEYKGQDNRIKLLCGASLISSKYVLTAGHCVTGRVLSVGRPINIRLGEYDTNNSGPDCVPAEGGGEECTDGLVILPIERTIPHPDYNPTARLQRNDIALIRMKDPAPYTDFIRPICLPTADIVAAPPKRFTLYVAGWGAINTSVASSNIKLHVDVPFSPMSTCQSAYSDYGRRISLWKGQMCAGGVAGKDSCKGDSGGPLMYENGRIFELLGIVSFGPSPCGLDQVPGVYTKVFEYIQWIRSNIQP